MSDLFDELEDRTQAPSSTDFAPWWDVDNEPDLLVGIVMEVHDGPTKYTPAGELPDPVYTILSLGKGGFDEGDTRSTRTHGRLLQGLEGVDLGDLVRLEYQGLQKTDNGNAANDYKIGIIPEEEWRDRDDADEIEEVIEAYSGPEGDNRSGEPVSGNDDSSSSESTSSSSGGGGNDLTEAASFLVDTVELQDGEMTIDQADKMLNDVRDFGVDVEDVAEMAGLTVGDNTVST